MRAAFLLLAASVSGIAAFAEKPVCTGWHDWGFRPVERTDGDPVGCYDAMDIAPDGRVSTPQQGELK